MGLADELREKGILVVFALSNQENSERVLRWEGL